MVLAPVTGMFVSVRTAFQTGAPRSWPSSPEHISTTARRRGRHSRCALDDIRSCFIAPTNGRERKTTGSSSLTEYPISLHFTYDGYLPIQQGNEAYRCLVHFKVFEAPRNARSNEGTTQRAVLSPLHSSVHIPCVFWALCLLQCITYCVQNSRLPGGMFFLSLDVPPHQYSGTTFWGKSVILLFWKLRIKCDFLECQMAQRLRRRHAINSSEMDSWTFGLYLNVLTDLPTFHWVVISLFNRGKH